MKKILLSILPSMLLSAILCVFAAPAAEAEAAEAQTQTQTQTGNIQLDMEEAMLGVSYDAMCNNMPSKEVKADEITIASKAIVLGEQAYIIVQYPTMEGNPSSPYCFIFDENGKRIQPGSGGSNWLTEDKEILAIPIDAFTGTKDIMVAFYYSDGAFINTDYTLWGAKKGTVTAAAWQGSMSVSSAKTGWTNTSAVSVLTKQESVDTIVSLPLGVNTDEVQVYLYDGDTQVGYAEINEWVNSCEVKISSLCAELKETPDIGYSEEEIERCQNGSGKMYFARKLTAGKYYFVKAVCGNQIYDLGSLYADATPFVRAALSSHRFAGNAPVVNVKAYGYNFADLTVRLYNRDTGVMWATGEGQMFYQIDSDSADYILATDKTIDELSGSRLIISRGDEEIYNSYFYPEYSKIVTTYYNHVDNTFVVKANWFPDGTALASEFYGNDGSYGGGKGQFVNGSAVLQIKTWEDAVIKPTPGKKLLTYEFRIDGIRGVASANVDVLGKQEATVNRISTVCYEAMQPIPLDITISCNLVKRNGPYYVSLDDADIYNVSLQWEKLTVEDVDCYNFKATLPAVPPGNYWLNVYGLSGGAFATYDLCVMDSTKIYARCESISFSDGGKGVEFYMPQGMEGYDKNLFAATVTDIMGNAIGVTAVPESDSPADCVNFRFLNLPADMLNVKVAFTYNGLPIYDIDSIAEGDLLAYKADLREKDSFSVSGTQTTCANDYELYTSFYPTEPAVAYIVETGTHNVVKALEYSAGETCFTKEMLEGLNYDTAAVAYDIYFRAKDGTGFDNWSGVYLGIKKETSVVTNGIGTLSNGAYVLYLDSRFASNYNGLYYWAERNQYVAVVGGYVDFGYNGLIELNGTWWYVKNGVVDFTYTGLTNANGGWWMVVGGAVDFTYNGLVEYGGAWWMVQNGAINFAYTGLAANEYGWWMVVGGAIDFSYTGLVANELGWWMVQNGAVNFTYTGLAANELGWWAIVGGAIDFGYTGLMANEFGWWYVQNGTINFGYTGLAQNEAGWWYVENGAINFGYTGTAMGPDGNNYNVVNGAVVF